MLSAYTFVKTVTLANIGASMQRKSHVWAGSAEGCKGIYEGTTERLYNEIAALIAC